MNENTKATQTSEGVDWSRAASSNRQWNYILLLKVALLTYRCLVAAGIVITIIILMNIDHKQFRLLNVMSQSDATRSTNSNGSELLNHSKKHLPTAMNHSGAHSSSYFIHYQTILKTTCQKSDEQNPRRVSWLKTFSRCMTATATATTTTTSHQITIINKSKNSGVYWFYPQTDVVPSDGWMKQDLYKDYVVYSPSCEIPNYPHFHEDIKPYFRKEKEINCTSKPQLTSVTRLASNSSYVLTLHNEYLSDYQVTSLNDVVCCYSVIHTNNDDVTMSECEIFYKNVKLNSSADLVRITCKDETTTIYENVHFLVPVKAEARHKIEKLDNGHQTDDETLSMMIVGLDSISRLNLLRTMPETVKYLERNGWYALKGYHKIEKNTFYNLNGPVLTGHLGNQLQESCWLQGLPLDSCPWIWKYFSEKHYITAYGEDGPQDDSFNYEGKFKEQPTDYFLRPHMKVAQGIREEKTNDRYPMCLGPKRSADYILDFSADFASRFLNYPTFSLFWVNAVGHINMNYPAMIDQKFISYLDTLDSSGVLNRSMVVFMSDHGFRMWDFRQTQMGFVEDSMPFLYIWLPKWYREKYPNKAENLARNTNRLTSHFDLFLTLMDVLGVSTKAAGCTKCVSLFDPVPWNRGCADAGIADYSCTCTRYEEIPTNSTLVKQMALLAVAHMNSLAAEYSNYLEEGYKCSTLSVRRIRLARREIVKNPNTLGQLYVIHVATMPGNGITEAIIQLHTLEVKSITDYTYYDHRSYCMKSRVAKAWCTCHRLSAMSASQPTSSAMFVKFQTK